MLASAVDGDALRREWERVRLLGVDAPELASLCQQGRRCAAGDPHASTRTLSAALAKELIRFQQFEADHYGRTLALFGADRVDLRC